MASSGYTPQIIRNKLNVRIVNSISLNEKIKDSSVAMLFNSLAQIDIAKYKLHFASETNMIQLLCDKSTLPAFIFKSNSTKLTIYSKIAKTLITGYKRFSVAWISKLLVSLNNVEYRNPEFFKAIILHVFEMKEEVFHF